MLGDALSEVLDLIEVRGVLSGCFSARGAWITQGALDIPVKFVVMARGRAEVQTNGTPEPVAIETGDVVIINHQSWLRVRGGPEGERPHEVDVNAATPLMLDEDGVDTLVGGHIDLNPIGRSLLHQALPAVSRIRDPTGTGESLRRRIDDLAEELVTDRAGAAFAVRQHAQLLVLDMLRAHLNRDDLPPGMFTLLTDTRLLPAVTLMHTQPGTAWQLHDLARAAGMSRTSFATRFRAAAGVPPLSYLSNWRMLLAQRALRDSDQRVGALASALGFGSETAFSTAFKRETGESPTRFRQRLRTTPDMPGD